jgi:hypothetical protein
MQGRVRTGSVGLLLLVSMLLGTVPTAQAQFGVGVQIDCDDDPVMNVHPLQNDDVEITCTVTNNGQVQEAISVDYEWQDDDPRVDMSLSEDSFDLAAGDEEDFTVVFSGSPRIEADLELGFDLIATVTSAAMIPIEQLNQTATYSGDFSVETFGMVDLTVTDRSTRNMEASEEVNIAFTMSNDGNDEDRIEVNIVNRADLEAAGFTFPQGTFVAETVAVDGTSVERSLVIRSPGDVAEEIRMQVILAATSSNDGSAEVSEVQVSVVVAPTSSTTSLGGGLEELSQDDLQLYGLIAGGALLALVLLGLVGRMLRKAGGPELEEVVTDMPEEPVAAPKAIVPAADEFDAMFDDLGGGDDLDAAFADL